MSRHLHTMIDIDASPSRVWEILTDFAAYPDWNPFIRRISGLVATDEHLTVTLQPPGGRAMTMKPTVRAAKPQQEFRWLGHLGIRGIFDGEHAFRIETLAPNRVRFIQDERFGGIFASLILRFIERDTLNGFEAMNQALKQRAEVNSSGTSNKG